MAAKGRRPPAPERDEREAQEERDEREAREKRDEREDRRELVRTVRMIAEEILDAIRDHLG
jgi:ribosomal protein S25